ncbi:MAG: GspE/PulE family protein [Planctomycetota bacterium]
MDEKEFVPATLPEIVVRVAEVGRVPATKLVEVHHAQGTDDRAFVQRVVEMGLLDEPQAYQLYAEVMGLDFENPETTDIDAAVICLLPEDIVQRYRAVPIRAEGEAIVVAMADPADLFALDALQEELRTPVVPVVCPPQTLRDCIEQRSRAGRGIEGLLARLDLEQIDQSAFANPQRLKEIAGDDAIVQLVDYMVEQAIRRKASDIHVEPGRRFLRVRYRIDGRLEGVQTLPKTLHAGIVSRIKILADLDIAERRRPQDGRFRFERGGSRPIEFRVSTMPSVHGEKAVLRLLDKSDANLDISALGLSPTNERLVRLASSAANGMVLVTGPTGSGKTTTLYGLLRTLNREDRNLVSVEDPVEYELDGVTQVQVDQKADRTFASVLRSMLRQDPDVIMVGEIRDRETAEISVNAALTGHMVLSTLHTNSALGTVTRLIDMGVAAYLIAPTLRAIVAQRLVRRLCAACSEPATAVGDLLAEIGISELVEGHGFRAPVGCPACRGKGFAGRTAIHEVLPWTPELARASARGAGEDELHEIATRQGFHPLLVEGARRAAQGVTTLEEVLAAART